VACANGGQAGIDMFRAACDGNLPFSAVITDLGMPLWMAARSRRQSRQSSGRQKSSC